MFHAYEMKSERNMKHENHGTRYEKIIGPALYQVGEEQPNKLHKLTHMDIEVVSKNQTDFKLNSIIL